MFNMYLMCLKTLHDLITIVPVLRYLSTQKLILVKAGDVGY